MYPRGMGDYFQFNLVFIKKIIKLNLKKKPNRNQFKPTSFGSVFRTKIGSNRFGLVFSGLGLVQFDFFSFKLIKPKPNQSVFFHDSFLSVF